jgi:hypothetical protein
MIMIFTKTILSTPLFILLMACQKKQEAAVVVPPIAEVLTISSSLLNSNSISNNESVIDISAQPVFTIKCSNAVDKNSAVKAIQLTEAAGSAASINLSYQNHDSVLVITSNSKLKYLTKYILSITTQLLSVKGGTLNTDYQFQFQTSLDSTDKFVRITDEALLDTIQRRTFAYFWDFGHPVSGLARERNSSADVTTSGGSGFGLMSIPVAVNRNFITRTQGLDRSKKVVSFLMNTAKKFHGAFPHWINGTTGNVVPFSAKDDGADLVETSYLMAGLLTLRQYFSNNTVDEIALRNDINTLWNGVEWTWFQKANENVLYWHWSPTYTWEMNLPIKGWNECLITYIMAASSNNYAIAKSVYQNGFASGSSYLNGSNFYNYTLPLGPSSGGPLFFSHYSFLGINPNGLTDGNNINYLTQVTNHTLINYTYSVQNPKKYYGYSDASWGLTACDIPGGYNACSPTNDVGVIAPTAAISSLPYTPDKSMKALRFYYYTLGDKLFKEYGFIDAYSLQQLWFSNTTLAIDQGPIIIMIENYRSQLIWNLLSNCPEVKRGLTSLGFKAPYL